MSVNSLSIDSNKPNFFNDEIEKRTDNMDTMFNIKYPLKNKDKVN
jgi:hypothetical protein